MRADLVSSAERLPARRRMRQSIAVAAIVLGGVGYAGAAAADGFWPWHATASEPTTTISTPSTPGATPSTQAPPGDAASAMSALHRGEPAVLPSAVRAALLETQTHYGIADLRSVRQVAVQGTTRVFAAIMADGAVCFTVLDGDSPSGSCATTLNSKQPIAAIVGMLANGDSMAAGVAMDGVTAVEALDANDKSICTAAVSANGFVCTFAGSMNDVAAFRVVLDGSHTLVPA
jgi:hypothetical protein